MFGLKLPKQDVVYADMITHLWRDCLALRVGKRGEAHVNDDDDDDSNGTRAGPFCQGGRARGVSVRVSLVPKRLRRAGAGARGTAAADDINAYLCRHVLLLERGLYNHATALGSVC